MAEGGEAREGATGQHGHKLENKKSPGCSVHGKYMKKRDANEICRSYRRASWSRGEQELGGLNLPVYHKEEGGDTEFMKNGANFRHIKWGKKGMRGEGARRKHGLEEKRKGGKRGHIHFTTDNALAESKKKNSKPRFKQFRPKMGKCNKRSNW